MTYELWCYIWLLDPIYSSVRSGIFLQKKMLTVALLAFLKSHWLIPCKYVIFLFSAKYAEDSCSILMSSAFEPCHHEVSPNPYVKNCRFDVCSCSNGKDCLCSAIANYAAACARKSVLVQWREPDFCRKWNAPKTQAFSLSQRNFLAVSDEKSRMRWFLQGAKYFLWKMMRECVFLLL